ncbi:MAG: LysM peptidoglycan-binding domain-containing protein [Chloroflexi bacterium]|nr:LysM peptidoglycan-binding domain-containing protein [Chloroflexota bacterium]
MSEETRLNEPQAASGENRPNETRGEWLNFGILVVVLLVTAVVIAAIQPLILGTIVPKVMGWDKPAITTPAEPAAEPAVEGEEPAAEVVEEMGEVEQVAPATETVPDTAAYPAPAEETAPAEEAAVPPTNNNFAYTVRAGDTLYDIARTYGTTIEAIVAASDTLETPNDVIKPGMVLTIPRP